MDEIIRWAGWIAMSLSLIGAVLNATGRITGFYVWIVSNGTWVVLNVYHSIWSAVILFATYTAISAYGIYAWQKKKRS